MTGKHTSTRPAGHATTPTIHKDPVQPHDQIRLRGIDPRPDNAGGAKDVYKNTKYPATHRSREQIERFFDGVHLVDSGLVCVSDWRPDTETDISPEEVWILGGVGRKPTADQPH
ncbi:SAM-dependent methyltransferase [Micromonospora inyonensis]|uniref:SAM-dependent methyltransferase n=1 Tax=Micromonospora inyonensis TaxID=47866 RepID=UPI000B87417C|nr:SAM-dependent methyltransferase [Micromonospora inyonensis]